MTVSQSSRIIKHLRKRPSKSFTARQLYNELQDSGISSGAISGLISKMARSGILTKDEHSPHVYTITNLSRYKTKNTATGGSRPGRRLKRNSEKATEPVIEPVVEEPVKLAKKEKTVSLKEIPTKKLIKELMRRVKK